VYHHFSASRTRVALAGPVAHALALLATASSRIPYRSNAAQEKAVRRDAETSTRDACATRASNFRLGINKSLGESSRCASVLFHFDMQISDFSPYTNLLL